jgi:hypothetical protein
VVAARLARRHLAARRCDVGVGRGDGRARRRRGDLLTVLERTAQVVRLDAACSPECGELAFPLFRQLRDGGYGNGASIIPGLDDIDTYLAEHRTARRRAARARRLGYTFAEIRREEHADAIYRINTSAPERQGRPMSVGYLERPAFSPLPEYPCERHAIRTYGVFAPDGPLVAYLVLYVCGDLVMVSQILGHADHLSNDVMYLLVVSALADEIPLPSTVFYNLHSSGTDGLRYFKERLGFREASVEWVL